MGTRIQNLANNFTTAGIVKAAAINNTSVSGITSLPSGVGGGLTLVSSQTASASASLEFSMDSTYDSYVFKFIDIHPSVDNTAFQFNGSTDGGSNYNVTKTTTFFRAYHGDTGSEEYTNLIYETSKDLAQSTSFQDIIFALGTDNDEAGSGMLQIFNPSSTTYVKHFISRGAANIFAFGEADDQLAAGYFNTTTAINAIKFQMSSGNIDDGIIKMYGVS